MPKSPQLVFLVKICRKRVYPLKRFLQNMSWNRESQAPPSCQISPLSLLKCGLTAPKSQTNFFHINLVKRLSDFYKIWLGEGSPRSSPSCHISPLWLKKSRQMVIFLYKFEPKRKFWGSTEKVEYRCTTTYLPLCNNTIIVLKITLLRNVSVITNFIIPKHDKQKSEQKTSHSFVYSRRATHDPHHTWHGDRF